MVSEGSEGRRTRTLRAEAALKALTTGPDSAERTRRVLEQVLVFAGASFAAVYTPGQDGDALCLAESAGVPRTLFGLRDRYPRAGHSPVADAHRTDSAVWLGPRELAADARARIVAAERCAVGVIRLRVPRSGPCQTYWPATGLG